MDALIEPDESILRPPWGQLGRALTLGVIAGASKLGLNVVNTTELRKIETLHNAVEGRPPGVGLLTVSNHTRSAARTAPDARTCHALKQSQALHMPTHP